ncbi:MAG: HAMP domain-containing histidine kinase [Pirellulales bacterium]|nr:HAMP domain-containing histidine kinase [Pirellulales bacterium]
MKSRAEVDRLFSRRPNGSLSHNGNSRGTTQPSEQLTGIGLLAAGIAHEINSPIGSALLAAETALAIKDLPEADGQLTACLENIVASTERCSRIVRSLLRYCRDEPPEKVRCSINDVARQAVDVMRPYAERQRIALRLECEPDVPQAPMNPLEIELVLVNLIRNALAASGEGSEVAVCTVRAEGVVRTSVRDNGRGMNRGQLAHVFDPLYTTHRSTGGCGLGLSIAREIIRRHEGGIEVFSRKGGGTLVRVDLPVPVTRALPAAEIAVSKRKTTSYPKGDIHVICKSHSLRGGR